MIDPKKDPRRRCMPLDEWPELDRQAWLAAEADGGILDDRGLAAHWRPHSKRFVINAYGRYLTFLDLHVGLDRSAGPADRMNPDWLRSYLADLQATIASKTVAGRIRGLAEAYRVMTPGRDYPYLIMARRRLKSRARPTRNKRAAVVPTQQLAELGLNLMNHAETGAFEREVWRACDYRDGLTILLLACRPIRRSNLAAMRLGIHLFKFSDRYNLSFDGSITKNHRPYDQHIDPLLTPYIERYLDHYRPILLAGAVDDHVWISSRAIPMSDCCLYGKVVKHTKAAFGHSLSPHLFRDSAMTTLGDENPEHVWLAPTLLHHADPRIAEQHYDHALGRRAVLDFQASVKNQRRGMMRSPKKHKLKAEAPLPNRRAV